jgi:protein-tyrosine phosphatase
MNFVTETSAYFVPNQCLFGAYPTQQQITALEDWGVELFVDLTCKDEKKIKPYETKKTVLKFPIPDRKVPENEIEFCALVLYVVEKIKSKTKIYVHCKGGHGRSGLLVAAVLCHLYRLSTKDSFDKTSKYHSTRPVHSWNPKNNEFWKRKGSPQTTDQKDFVKRMFQPYAVTSDSPFNETRSWVSGDYDDFFFTTNLGFVLYGKFWKELEDYRNDLIRKTHTLCKYLSHPQED